MDRGGPGRNCAGISERFYRALRPSRRPLRGLLRMTFFLNSNHKPTSSKGALRRSRFASRRTLVRSALDAARLVDQRERLGEAGEWIGVGRRRAFLRDALHHRLFAFGERGDDRLVEVRGPRPGAVVLGEQLEFAAADIERDLAALLQRIAFDKAHDIGDFLDRTMGHHRGWRLAPEPGRLALFRLADEVADLAGLVL